MSASARTALRRIVGWGPWLLAALLAGCDCGGGAMLGGRCATSGDCSRGMICVDGRCRSAASPDAGGGDSGGPEGGCAEGTEACADRCCGPSERCIEGSCVPVGERCEGHEECEGDAYCDAMLGACLPWGSPPGRTFDPGCARIVPPGAFRPTVQCAFREAPPGDPFPTHLHVLSTVVVADLRADDRGPDDPARPSLIAVFDDGVDGGNEHPTGVIRILDGRTCAQQAQLGSLQLVSHSSPPAIGDLDADGRPEIVAYMAGGGLVAFTFDPGARAWRVLWTSRRADGTPYRVTGGGWTGPSLYDLDDDGRAEVLRGGVVLAHDGTLLDESLGVMPFAANTGLFAVVADVDEDGHAELVQGNGVWQWDRDARRWVAESWSPGGTEAGHTALADFGAYPGRVGWPAHAPEVVVVSPGTVRVQTLDGQILFGPHAIPGGGAGGPPTVADFDGDGRPEFATAGASFYTVFDLDCGPMPVGTCATGSTNGVLWSQPSQDQSSNRTGSSVFDFEADGRAEVVYADECFVRVYDGRSGEVLFSQAHSSCTWYENPVVADVDGDFNAEIVIGSNYNCGSSDFGITCHGLEAGNVDPLYAGARCQRPEDCLSGRCDAGFCRCTTDAECCSGEGCDLAALRCAPPPAGTPGSGNTCRASRPRGTLGLRVYRDAADRWVSSRMLWNQHVYHVTNVEDDLRVPRTSRMRANWRTAGLNNFRQNVQGDAVPGAAPDLTVRALRLECGAEGQRLLAEVCNRGAAPVGAELVVTFVDAADGAAVLCRAETARVLVPGACETVSCVASMEVDGRSVTAIVDDGDDEGECREGNNRLTGGPFSCLG